MKVKAVLELLKEEDPESELMIQWVTQAHASFNSGLEVDNAQWLIAVRLFDTWGLGIDTRDVEAALDEASGELEDF